MKNICFVYCIRTKNFKAVKIPSATDLFIRPTRIVCQRIPPPVSRIYPQSFQNFRISEFCNRQFLPIWQTDFSSITLLSQLLRQTIDKFITVLYIQPILSSLYPGQILSAMRLKICPLRPKFVKQRQTIRTCKMLVTTENL